MDVFLEQKRVAIIGGGPAGLRAAEVCSTRGLLVSLHESKPSVGRKFLVAGRGGLNLTHSEELTAFVKRYKGSLSENKWTSILDDWKNTDLRTWAEGLGISTFIGTSGRVFPTEKKAAPLLRAWIRRLREKGVSIHTRSRLQRIKREDDCFHLIVSHTEGETLEIADAVILALGGASWPTTGSDGAWVPLLESLGLQVQPLQPANCGWNTNWNPDILSKVEGLPLKNLAVTAGDQRVLGELLITRYGLEGGALYQLGHTLRSLSKPCISLDFKPGTSLEELIGKTPDSFRFSEGFFPPSWRLSEPAEILLGHAIRHLPDPSPSHAAALLKNFQVPLEGPRPIAEAISSAGGVAFEALDDHLMVSNLPGLFLAGEMLDWEAPTGGYLLQGCFATGTRAAQGAALYLEGNPSAPTHPVITES